MVPELVGQAAEEIAPKGIFQRIGRLAAFRQPVVQPPDLLLAGAVEAKGNGIPPLKPFFPDHVRPHQHQGIRYQDGVQDDLPELNGNILLRIAERLQGQFAAEAFLVEGHSLTAVAVEGEVSVDSGHLEIGSNF